ncbi:MAG: hypothetical protein U9P44_00305 [archaeon]|nr:hypothetical protein [archaeon]
MINILKVVSEKSISFAEAKKILDAKEKSLHENSKELGYEQKITQEYLRSIAVVDVKTAEEVEKKLLEEIPTLKEHQIFMILNLLPENEEDVELLFAKERIKLEKDQTDKIVKIIEGIRPKEAVKAVKKKPEDKDETSAKTKDDTKKEKKEEGKKQTDK